ncbi:MAG TPA: DUF5615 family PIN-like protein [Fimbriimonadaceae bacterium]|nr:DUF5615 family PIN-like protein [Fimbriimonadaceae bacterium]HRE93116.1 DUF5615 family PIN-like protein [Fimbriimonadaceae bacterium]HRI75010.1 DUF5615 family PIN-like protein [Fimbriimonadaceae bacterium]
MATFLFDNDISFRLARALNELVGPGHECIALRERFDQSTPDEVWIPVACQEGWIIVSRDLNQRKNRVIHSSIRVSDAKALYIRTGKTQLSIYDDAARIIKNWPKILRWAEESNPGTISRLRKEGVIENVLPDRR